MNWCISIMRRKWICNSVKKAHLIDVEITRDYIKKMVVIEVSHLPAGLTSWVLLELQGEISGVVPGKPIGSLDESGGTLTLAGSGQVVKGKAAAPTTRRLVCRKRIREDGTAYVEVIGTLTKSVVFMGAAKK